MIHRFCGSGSLAGPSVHFGVIMVVGMTNRVRPDHGVKVTVTCTEENPFLWAWFWKSGVSGGPAPETSHTMQ